MPVKITILYDNLSDNELLLKGWGFSAFIEFDSSKILFDTGGDARIFSSNADQIQLPYNEITHILVSHRHWDHIAGFKQIVKKVKKETVIYVPKSFPLFSLRKGANCLKKIKVVENFEAIASNIYSLVLRGGFWLYEQALILKTSEGLVIVTGCAHPGIIKVLEEVQKHFQEEISLVLGGFHLHKASEEYCYSIVKQFQSLNVQKVAPCHCSGDLIIRQFQKAYGSNFLKICPGTVLSF